MTDRPDLARLRAANNEPRLPERLRAHFDLERDLAGRLLSSLPSERASLYSAVYSELFARLPDHPQHKIEPAKRRRNTANQVAFLRHFLRREDVFVEVGCGDAAVTQGLCGLVAEAVGVDVTAALIDHAAAPGNFRFVPTDGITLALPSGSVDVVYSNQLMEHLHPDDAPLQLAEIWRVLKPGGRYICSTPNRITGPHDISGYFGYEPVGLHLREYDHAALAAMFRQVGFSSSKARVSIKGRQFLLPVSVVAAVERGLMALPRAMRVRMARVGFVRNLAGVMLVGRK